MQTTWEQDLGMPPLVSSNVIPVLTSTTQPFCCLPFLEPTAPTKLLPKSSTEQIKDENRLIWILNSWTQDHKSKAWRVPGGPRSILVTLSLFGRAVGENAHRMGQRNGDGCPGWRNLLRVCSTKGSTEKNGEVSTPASNTASLRNHL